VGTDPDPSGQRTCERRCGLWTICLPSATVARIPSGDGFDDGLAQGSEQQLALSSLQLPETNVIGVGRVFAIRRLVTHADRHDPLVVAVDRLLAVVAL
jgi:hypothetical protein